MINQAGLFFLLDYYLGPGLFIVVGIVLLGLGLLTRADKAVPTTPAETVPSRPAGEEERAAPSKEQGAGSGFTRVVDWLHSLAIPAWIKPAFLVIGVLLIVVGLGWIEVLYRGRPAAIIAQEVVPTQMAIAQTQTAIAATPAPAQAAQTSAPTSRSLLGVSLAGLKYAAGGWDPRSVDLTSAATDGIRVNEGDSLRLYDLRVSVPKDVSGYAGQFEIFMKGAVIGRSDLLELKAGGTLFEKIVPIAYQHADVENAWKVQKDWDQLDLALNIYLQNKPVDGAVIGQIQLNGSGKAWFKTPPYATILTLVYHVNQGPQKILDFRSSPQDSFEAGPRDTLTIDEIYSKASDTISNQSMQVEAYLNIEGKGITQSLQSTPVTFRQGMNDLLNGKPLTWENLPADSQSLIIFLTRDDGSVLDSLVLTLNSGQSNGLPVGTNVSSWPAGAMKYLDFETPADLAYWKAREGNVISLSKDKAFSGSSSLAVTTKSGEDQRLIEQVEPVPYRLVVGQVYWPEQKGISWSWVEICARANFAVCESIPKETNQWLPFSIELTRPKNDQGEVFDTEHLIDVWLQGHLSGASEDNPYTFYIDGLQFYPDIK